MDNIHKKFSQAKTFLFHLLDPNQPIAMLLRQSEPVILKPREAPLLP